MRVCGLELAVCFILFCVSVTVRCSCFYMGHVAGNKPMNDLIAVMQCNLNSVIVSQHKTGRHHFPLAGICSYTVMHSLYSCYFIQYYSLYD